MNIFQDWGDEIYPRDGKSGLSPPWSRSESEGWRREKWVLVMAEVGGRVMGGGIQTNSISFLLLYSVVMASNLIEMAGKMT